LLFYATTVNAQGYIIEVTESTVRYGIMEYVWLWRRRKLLYEGKNRREENLVRFYVAGQRACFHQSSTSVETVEQSETRVDAAGGGGDVEESDVESAWRDGEPAVASAVEDEESRD